MPFVFRKWYEENAASLSEKRRARYKTDPAYREAAKARSKAARAAKEPVTRPQNMVSLAEAADELGVIPWTVNRWRNEGLFPEPLKQGNTYYFTPEQVQLIAAIRDHFIKYPKRSALTHRDELDAIKDVIAHNWS